MSRREAARVRQALSDAHAKAESVAAQKLIDQFLIDVAAAGIPSRPLKATTLDGHVVKTDKVGWCLRTNKSLGLDELWIVEDCFWAGGLTAVSAALASTDHIGVGMGIVPLEFVGGDSPDSLGLTGHETLDFVGLAHGIETGFAGGKLLTVKATAKDGSSKSFQAKVRIDTPAEVQYYRHGGILQYVLRSLARK